VIEDLKSALSDPDLAINEKDFELIFREAFSDGKDKIGFEDFKKMMEHLAT
jgi:Ca2+-binding EF-hand superfamily protein